jgi:uncharacterized protein (TIGR03083 family)
VLDADSIDLVLRELRPERAALRELLGGLRADEWDLATECPLYSVKGVATHILGDDLSLLSRQRDRATNGLVQLAGELPGVGFRGLLDSFNDRWVLAARFLSTELVVELLDLAGEWTAAYYEAVDPNALGEPVGFFGSAGSPSPFWHAIAREYVERWVHHSQIRRALGRRSLSDHRFLTVGLQVVAATAGVDAGVPARDGDPWMLGPIELGSAQAAADILTRAHTADEIRGMARGPEQAVDLLASLAGRP